MIYYYKSWGKKYTRKQIFVTDSYDNYYLYEYIYMVYITYLYLLY